MSFPRYATYKESDVEWLAEVPRHWNVMPVKSVATTINGYPFDSQLFDPAEGFPLIRIRDLGAAVPEAFYRGDFVPSAAVTADDILIGMDGDFNVGRWRGEGTALLNQRMCCVRGISRPITRFLEYALPQPLKAINDITYSTTVKHLSSFQVEKVRIALPPDEDELCAIIGFLDHETAKIDALVEEQRRLIALLKEKCQAVISHAVTEGLDPNAAMKESGVEWLGRVPEHWSLHKIKHLYRLVKRPFKDGLPVLSVYREYGVIEKDSRIDNFNKTPEDLTTYQSVRPNDLVINKMKAWQGSLGVSDFCGATSPDYVVYEAQHSQHSPFMHYLLRSARMPGVYHTISNGIRPSQWRLEPEKFEQLVIPLPPVIEQRAIAVYLDSVRGRSSALVEEAMQAIALLQERRTALISAAITGKINLRGVETRTQPLVQTDRGRVRMIVAAEIMERLANKQTFGRVKLQKLVYLAETHANMNELQGRYLREAAGPLDRDMIEEMETKLQGDGFTSVEQPGGRGAAVTYRVKRRGAYREDAGTLLGSRARALTRLLNLLGDLDTKSVEAITTLYAVWNDALLDRVTPTDDFIVSAFLNDWHPEKTKKFKQTELFKWLHWMRRHELVPNGTVPRTVTGRLFA